MYYNNGVWIAQKKTHRHKTLRKRERLTKKERWKRVTANTKLNLNTIALRESGWDFLPCQLENPGRQALREILYASHDGEEKDTVNLYSHTPNKTHNASDSMPFYTFKLVHTTQTNVGYLIYVCDE